MIKCLVPISGGKDSQSCLKLAIHKYGSNHVLGLFCDTKFEHDITYNYIDTLRKFYNVDIVTISFGDVLSQCLKNGRFPSDNVRFCTNELKIKPTKQFCSMLARLQKSPFEVWYGMRKSESIQRSKRYKNTIDTELYPPHLILSAYPKYLYEKFGITFRLPICDWSKNDVFDYLDGFYNPLYDMGFDRVGCFPCLAGGDWYKEKSFKHDNFGKNQRIKVKNVELEINKDVFTTKKGWYKDSGLNNSLCFVCQQ